MATGMGLNMQARRHGGWADGRHQQAALAQHARQAQGLCAVADHDGLDRRWAVHQLQPDLLRAFAELANQRSQMLTPPSLAAQQLQALERGTGKCPGAQPSKRSSAVVC